MVQGESITLHEFSIASNQNPFDKHNTQPYSFSWPHILSYILPKWTPAWTCVHPDLAGWAAGYGTRFEMHQVS